MLEFIQLAYQVGTENKIVTIVLIVLLAGLCFTVVDGSEKLWDRIKACFAIPFMAALYIPALYYTNSLETYEGYKISLNKLFMSDKEFVTYAEQLEQDKQNEVEKWRSLVAGSDGAVETIDLLRIDERVENLNEIAFDNFKDSYVGKIIETTAPLKNLEEAEWNFEPREGYKAYWIVLRHRGFTKEVPKSGIDPASIILGNSTRTVGFGLTYQFSGNCEIDENLDDLIINKEVDSPVKIRSYIGNVSEWGFSSRDNWCVILP